MSAFKSSADADRFALRAKHREWDDGDIEAVWDQARDELFRDNSHLLYRETYEPSDEAIQEQCLRILENRCD